MFMLTTSDAFASGATQRLSDALAGIREWITLRIETLVARPSIVHRIIFRYLRTKWPILVIGRVAFVSRYEDVSSVLADGNHFNVVYDKKIRQTTGLCVVGMSDTPEYHYQRELMNEAVNKSDQATIRAIVKRRADELVAAAPGRIDLVGGHARDVAATVAREYLGVHASLNEIMRWSRAIFREIFLDFRNNPEIGSKAQLASAQLKDYLGGLIEERSTQIEAGQQTPDDFLCRILRHIQPGMVAGAHDVVYRIVAGTFVGALDNNCNWIANGMDFLLDHPALLEEAHQAALANDDQLLLAIMLEALRFYPQNPFLIRRCQRTCTLAPWTDHATLIIANTLVLAGTASAMFDGDKFKDPEQFRTDRALHDYLHFGRGMHECFGSFIANVVVPETAKALLRRRRLRRARGRDGRIHHDGAFADHLFVEFD
jgi:cytochrome P450